tara:strand:+ start:8193 stop:10550 length:2358 start_codon:yes stop_codon:yes gene_type:complete
MNLNKRALLVITPVVLLSFIVASMVVYEIARNFLERQEQYRINSAIIQLEATFGRYTTFTESYLMSITQSHALHQYLLFLDDETSDLGLARNLEDTLRATNAQETDYLSVTVGMNSAAPVIRTHIEFSEDPFSAISPALENFVTSMLADNEMLRWSYLEEPGKQNFLIKAELIDPITMVRPLPSQNGNALVIALAIEPTEFNALRAQLEQELGAAFVIGAPMENLPNLSASIELLDGQFLSIALPFNHLQEQLLPMAGWLLLISLIFSTTASICLYGLTTRYITRPVLELERDLADVLANRRDAIPDRHLVEDEIGSLAKTFRSLYDKLSHSHEETRRLMERDSLTGLFNLNFINKVGQQALNKAKERSEQLALMYLDLDNFKFVNDKYGHRFGDELLTAFGLSLSDISVIRSSNSDQGGTVITPGRVAGDQFCLLIRQKDATSAAQDISTMILQQMEEGLHFAKARFPITTSIGIALYPQDGDSFSQLISNADTAMAQAKLQGKNQVAFYSQELAEKIRRRQEIESALKVVNPDLEFKLVYMPLLNVRTGELDGFEALLRWNSRRFGVVDPDEFVPIAESCGVFAMIDEWVISKGLSSYPAIRKLLARDFKMSLNISSAQLQVSNLTEVLDRYTKRFNIAPQYIQLEITETVNIELTKHSHTFLHRLSEAGYVLALDDFGAGFTSLLRIVEYPITMVKFDKSFIQQTLKRGNRQILKPLVELCHSNGLLVTMEGAESQEDIDLLSTYDCDFIQGYFLGLPISLEEMEDALRKLRKASRTAASNA